MCLLRFIVFAPSILLLTAYLCFGSESETSGNPLFPGWYADPEGLVFGDEYWIFPTYSAEYTKQLHLDAFSSKNLVHWRKHHRILDTNIVKWARQAMWAPAAIEKDGRYYLFFAANDVQRHSGRLCRGPFRLSPQGKILRYVV